MADDISVAYIPPEDVRRGLRNDAVSAYQNDPDGLSEALDNIEREAVGEYRIVEDVAVEDGVQKTVYGDLAVWVDPDGDGDGRYEPYNPAQHGEPYSAIFREGQDQPVEDDE